MAGGCWRWSGRSGGEDGLDFGGNAGDGAQAGLVPDCLDAGAVAAAGRSYLPAGVGGLLTSGTTVAALLYAITAPPPGQEPVPG